MMAAYGPRPEEQASGAPAVEGQAAGAGGLAPGAASPELVIDVEQLEKQLEQLKEELEAELVNECGWIGEKMDIIDRDPIYGSYTDNALLTFRDVAFRFPVHPETVESVMRVIDVCRKANTTKLLDYVPDVRDIVERLKRAVNKIAKYEEEAEDEEEREEIAAEKAALEKIAKRLEEMTYTEFLEEGEEIIETLRDYEYYETANDLEDYVDVMSMLSNVLVEETRRLGKVFNIEDEAEDLIFCIVGC